MIEKPWQMFLFNPMGLEREAGDRLLEQAGFASRLSLHTTEEEAKAAAEEVLRKLKNVDETEWVACYVLPYAPGSQKDRSHYPRITAIRSSDLAG